MRGGRRLPPPATVQPHGVSPGSWDVGGQRAVQPSLCHPGNSSQSWESIPLLSCPQHHGKGRVMVPDLIQSQSCGDALIYLSRHLIDGGSGGPNNCLDCAVAGGAGDSHPVPFSSQAAGPAPRQGHPPKVRDSLPAHPVSPSIRLRDARQDTGRFINWDLAWL